MADASNLPGPKLPGIGKVKPIYLVGGLGLVIGIVGYAWWKNGQASAGDTTGATDATAADPGASDYIPPYSAFNTSGGTDLSQLPPLDNPAWSQRVQDLLSTIGFDPNFIANTIGKYLGRQQLTTAESDLVRTAISMVGLPPVGQFALIPTSTPTPTPTPVPVTPKPTTGLPAQVTGLHIHSRTSKSINLSWNRASGALGYALYRNGKAINFPPTSNATVGTIHATYTVKARNTKGYGPASAPLKV
jgi:hypothetical protein